MGKNKKDKDKKEETIEQNKNNAKTKENNKEDEKMLEKKDKKDEIKTDKKEDKTVKDKTEKNNKEVKKDKEKKKKKKDKKDKKPKLTRAEKRERRGSFWEKLSLKFRKRLMTSKLRTWILVIVLVLLFIIINLWASAHDTIQIDVTENQIYTLSQTSKDQLESLDKEVMIYVYGYEDSDTYVEFVKQYVAFNDNISYEIVTTETNYEIITEYELDDYGYAAFVIVCGEKDSILYPDYEFYEYDYNTGSYADTTEECITNAIINVSSDESIKVYFATGHGEYTTSYMSYLIEDLEAVVYDCEELNLLTATEVPEDCDVLAIIAPSSDISEDEAEILKDYINNGGNMLVSMYKADDETDYTNFENVLALYGAEVEYGLLYEGSSSYYYYYPYWPVVVASSSSEITADISSSGYYAIFPYSQNIVISNVDEDDVEVESELLLYTSDYCYNITDSDMINQGLSIDGLEQASYTVAAKFTRTLTISDESEETSDDTESEEDSEDEEEETIESNLILIGNCYIFLDETGIYSGAVADATFLTNSFADLAEQDNLLTIKKYETSSSDFDKTATTASHIVVQTIVFGLPIVIILVGIIIWAVRRRKR